MLGALWGRASVAERLEGLRWGAREEGAGGPVGQGQRGREA